MSFFGPSISDTTFNHQGISADHFIEQGETKANLANTISEKESVEKKRDTFKGGYDQKNRIVVSMCLGFISSMCFFAGYNASQYLTQKFTLTDIIATGVFVSLVIYFFVANKILNQL